MFRNGGSAAPDRWLNYLRTDGSAAPEYSGDKYFRIDYPEHNLVRARAQLALYQDMMAHMEEMQRIVKELVGYTSLPKKSWSI